MKFLLLIKPNNKLVRVFFVVKNINSCYNLNGDNMAKRKNKAKQRRILIFGTVSLAIIVYFVFSVFFYSYKFYVLNKEEKELISYLDTIKTEEEELKSLIAKLKDPEYLARFAQEEYMYSRDNEYIIMITEKEREILDKKSNIKVMGFVMLSSAILFIILVLFIIKKKTAK